MRLNLAVLLLYWRYCLIFAHRVVLLCHVCIVSNTAVADPKAVEMSLDVASYPNMEDIGSRNTRELSKTLVRFHDIRFTRLATSGKPSPWGNMSFETYTVQTLSTKVGPFGKIENATISRPTLSRLLSSTRSSGLKGLHRPSLPHSTERTPKKMLKTFWIDCGDPSPRLS